jgi:hypothetical protein
MKMYKIKMLINRFHEKLSRRLWHFSRHFDVQLCSDCFQDQGLRYSAERIGFSKNSPCPQCDKSSGKKLDTTLVHSLAHQFFVRGSLHRMEYGAAPMIQFNEYQYQRGDFVPPEYLKNDVRRIEETIKIGFFHYGPRLWMCGEVEPLKQLQDDQQRKDVVKRIIKEYPTHIWKKGESVFRLRVNPANPDLVEEYDSPPLNLTRNGRFDSKDFSILYCSPDVEVCLHECRVTVEDKLFLATLASAQDFKMLNLAALIPEEEVSEFESLDMAVHMLFMAGKHSYEISRDLAMEVKNAGYDGIIYPSYFTYVRSGEMPFDTAGFGISVRRFPAYQKVADAFVVPNICVFGNPVKEGKMVVNGINKISLRRVSYDVQFGPP